MNIIIKWLLKILIAQNPKMRGELLFKTRDQTGGSIALIDDAQRCALLQILFQKHWMITEITVNGDWVEIYGVNIS